MADTLPHEVGDSILKTPLKNEKEHSATRSSDRDSTLFDPSDRERSPSLAPSLTEGNKDQQTQDEDTEENVEYAQSWELYIITIGLCLAVFCLAIDNTILATAIPKITDQFNSLGDIGWYGSAYLLTFCALTLQFGKMYTFYSTKWVFLSALAFFEIGSLICGVAPNSLALIIGRAIAGIGSAGLFSGAILILAQCVPLQKRPMFTGGLWSMYGVASIAGPLMGGAFTDHVTWRWCFYINLPLGGITLVFITFFFKAPKPIKALPSFKDELDQLDLVGSFFFVPAIICILLALQWGGTEYAWDNARIIVLFCLFGVLTVIFIIVESFQGEKATVPGRIFKNRNIWGASIYSFSLGAGFYSFVYYIPIWFQAIKGVTATKSGIMSIPMLLSCIIFILISGILVTRFGHYTPLMYIGSIFFAVGAGLITTWQVDTTHSAWIGYLVILGIGIGLGMQAPLIVVQAVLPAEDIATGTALQVFAQMLGGTIFISVCENIFHNQLLKNLAEQAPNVDGAKLVAAGATMVRTMVSSEVLPTVLQAYNKALVQTFYCSAAMAACTFIGCLPLSWKPLKGKKIEATAA
ncbi:hypothetical protein ARAM_005002 [Aspergillus rambellii]|uniref:Major facilitator superfamily (MFS) profile domain-containing protein n=1 Tax=Aspergillus rambellii TaxID=308745 RepID=A0A0F8TWZ8_9EURO|nr:hypothetical protein ARAM_005002 [Aspergillus rambellii]